MKTEVEKAKEVLKQNGYCISALWHENDVPGDLSREQKSNILTEVLSGFKSEINEVIKWESSLQDLMNRSGRIVTENICPPIPIRSFDWRAVREGYDEGDFIGYGETEQDAINDLLEKEESL